MDLSDRIEQGLALAVRSIINHSSFDFEPGTDRLVFVHALSNHGLLFSLNKCLNSFSHGDERFVALCRDVSRQQFFHSAQYRHLLKRLHDECESTDMSILLLKGAALSLEYYEDIGERTFGDIDIYVSEGQREKIEKVLLRCGLRGEGTSYCDERFCRIDLHVENLGRVEALCGLSGASLLQRSVSIPGFPRFATLHPLDQKVYLAIHALKHCYARYIWLIDIYKVGLDCETLVLHPAGRVALRCARSVLNCMCAQSSQMPELTWWERRMVRAGLENCDLPTGQFVLACHQPGLWAKLRFLFRAAETVARQQELRASKVCRVFQEFLEIVRVGVTGRCPNPLNERGKRSQRAQDWYSQLQLRQATTLHPSFGRAN